MSLAENWQPYVDQDNDIKFSLKFAVGLYSQGAIANWSWKILIIYIIFVLKIHPHLFISFFHQENFSIFYKNKVANNSISIRSLQWDKNFFLVNYFRCLFPNYFLSKSYRLFKSTFDRLQKKLVILRMKLNMKCKM